MVRKWSILQCYRSIGNWKSASSPSWLWSEQSQEGQVLLIEEDIQTKGLTTTTKHHVSLVFHNYNPNRLFDATGKCPWSKTNRQERNSLGIQVGRNINQTAMSYSYPAGNNSGWLLRVRSFQAPVILADEPTGNLDEQTAGDIIAILEVGQGTPKMCHRHHLVRKWRRPPMWSWN